MPDSIKTIIETLDAALDYEETGDLAKAATVITLCKRLLLRRPDSSGHAGSSASFSSDQLRRMMEDARIYIGNANGASSGARFLGVYPRR